MRTLHIFVLASIACLFMACDSEIVDPEIINDDDDDNDGDDDDTAEQLMISGLLIEQSTNNNLTFTVSWLTNLLASSRVEFGSDDHGWFFVEDSEPVTEHELLITGLRSEQLYELEVISENNDIGVISETSELETDELPHPFNLLLIDFNQELYDPDQVDSSFTLVNVLAEGLSEEGKERRNVPVVLDQEGQVVWFRQLDDQPSRGDLVVTEAEDGMLFGAGLIAGEHVQRINWLGEVLWEGPEQSDAAYGFGQVMHHHAEQLDNGNYLMLQFDDDGGDVIREINPELEVVWEWYSTNHQDQIDQPPFGNMVEVDLEAECFYYNSFLNRMYYKISRDNGQILWALGLDGDFDISSPSEYPIVSGTHSPRWTKDGTLLFYDNQGHPDGTRLVEYLIDEQAMTAELIWEYPGELAEDYWYQSSFGSVERLMNDNTFYSLETGVLNEVTPVGEKVWQIHFGIDAEEGLAFLYRAERIPPLTTKLN